MRILNGVHRVIKRWQLAKYINDYLACDAFQDYAPNGLQVEGRADIKRICTAVSASEEVIRIACHKKADALLVHHGFFWRGENPAIIGIKRQRISQLILADMNLFGYHLPLDCHSEIGNNACLADRFGFKSVEKHFAGKTPDLLWTGHLQEPLSLPDFARFIADNLKREPFVIQGSDKLISRVAWCSGGAQDFIEAAQELGVDAYLSGEVSERTYYQAREMGLHYLACGHHATERYGIQALGQHLSKKFDLEHEFIDSGNPV